jgi:hypothetical protein
VWWGVLAVALCGVVATAHGLYAVAVASGVATPVACLYVPITDGLALVAYASTGRLSRWDRGYAWLVVVVAAGLSGLAQAVNLAGLGEPDWRLRFGVGYWPAVAVAVAAHLLWLVGSGEPSGAAAAPVSQPAGGVEPSFEPGPEPAREPSFEPEVEPPILVGSAAAEPAREPVVEPEFEPRVEPGFEPAAQAGSAVVEPAPEPEAEPSVEPAPGPAEPAAAELRERVRLAVVPAIQPGRPVARKSVSKPSDPRVGLRFQCGCGCGQEVSRMTLDRHAERAEKLAREAADKAAELAGRAQSNGHREPVSAGS